MILQTNNYFCFKINFEFQLWGTDHNPEDVEEACRKSLEDLQLEYFDTFLIHWPVGYKVRILRSIHIHYKIVFPSLVYLGMSNIF